MLSDGLLLIVGAGGARMDTCCGEVGAEGVAEGMDVPGPSESVDTPSLGVLAQVTEQRGVGNVVSGLTVRLGPKS